MFSALIKIASWRAIKDLFSGKLLRLFPPSTAAHIVKTLVNGRSDVDLLQRGERQAKETIDRLGLSIQLDTPASASTVGGDELLRLYFGQLFGGPVTFLDLRSTSFDGAQWQPGRLVVEWDPEFIQAVRGMYTSFYHGTDADFDEAVDRLGMKGRADLFRRHFGENQTSVMFDVSSFRTMFEDILADDSATELPADFGIFGIYLICLYEHLEKLGGGPFNVVAAFEQGFKMSSGSAARHPRVV